MSLRLHFGTDNGLLSLVTMFHKTDGSDINVFTSISEAMPSFVLQFYYVSHLQVLLQEKDLVISEQAQSSVSNPNVKPTD